MIRKIFRRLVSLIYVVLQLFFQNLIVRLFLHHPKYNKKYKISICAIFKNESSFLKEWVEYHEMLGIEHFFLYNNNSEDDYLAVLKPYIDKGLVTLIDWPYDQGQITAYKHFYETYRHETQWVSFLDIDEFFCPRYKNNLLEWLKTMDKYPVIVVYWRMFGTSGKLEHDYSKLVIEQYTVSWDHLYHCGKCLVNTDYDIASFGPTTHHLTRIYFPLVGKWIRVKMFPVNQFGWFFGDRFYFDWFSNEDRFTIQVNHYWSKAWDVYEKKRRMTDVYFKENPKLDMSYFYYHEYNNRTSEYTIYRFLMQLKLKLSSQEVENVKACETT